MKRYYNDGQQWYVAILPPGVHPLDPDAANRVIRWEPCEPPMFSRPGRPEALPAPREWDGAVLLVAAAVIVVALVLVAL